jgi:hypothetical protein
MQSRPQPTESPQNFSEFADAFDYVEINDVESLSSQSDSSISGSFDGSEGEQYSNSDAEDSEVESRSNSGSDFSGSLSGSASDSDLSETETETETKSASDTEEMDLSIDWDMYHDYRRVANAYFISAETAFENRNFQSAKMLYEDAVLMLSKLPEIVRTTADYRNLETYYNNLAVACHREMDNEQEVKAYRAAWEALSAALSKGDQSVSCQENEQWIAKYSYYLADCYLKLNQMDEYNYYIQNTIKILSPYEKSWHTLETILILVKCHIAQEDYLPAVKLLQAIDSSSDEYFRLLAQSANELAFQIDSYPAPVSEATVLSVRYLVDAVLAASRIKKPTGTDIRKYYEYQSNLEVCLDDIKDTLQKLDGMRSLMNPPQASISTSVFSVFAFAPPQPQPAQNDEMFIKSEPEKEFKMKND